MTFRVLSAEASDETNTFNCRKTDEQAFRDRYFLPGVEAVVQRGEANGGRTDDRPHCGGAHAALRENR
jgi:hypothetical protein